MSPSIALAQCLISVGIIAFIWAGPAARIRRDNFRARIRRIRDDLFDFMLTHHYDFNTPAYGATRQTLNGMIRCSNYFSVVSFLHSLVLALRTPQPELSPGEQIEKLQDEPLKTALKSALNKAMREMISFIFVRNISGLLSIPIITAFCVVVAWLSKTAEKSKDAFVDRPAHYLLQEAYVSGTHGPISNGLALPTT